MTNDHVPPSLVDDELRTLLHARAGVITPRGNPMTEIGLRHSLRRKQRRVIAATGAAATLVAVVGAIVVGGPILLGRGPDSGLPAGSTSAGVETLTDDSFAANVLQAEDPVLVNITAAWCPEPCLSLAPVLEDIAREHADTITVFSLDYDKSRHTAEKYANDAVPTLVIFDNGRVVKTIRGFTSEDELLKQLEAFL